MRAIFSFLIAVIVGAALLAYFAFFIVNQNEQALVLEFGKPKRVIDRAGLHWKIPVVETVEYFDKRILDLDMTPQEVPAADQKLLLVDAFARYRIKDPLKFYQAVTSEYYVPQRFGPIVQSTLRRVLGTASFIDIVRNKREALMKQIATEVNKQGQEFGLEVVDVRIKRADLPEKNLQSVYDRMKADRFKEAEELRAEGRAAANKIQADADRDAITIRAEARRKADQLRGEGDAERNRIFAEVFNRDPAFFSFYRSMQAYEQGIKSGDTRMLLSPDSEFFRYFNNPSGTPTPAPQTTGQR
ncbi:MAG: protease modulator HflC [Hyphomicrobium sp.]|uniref:protease modulator HflC n=1 Tax=Hyphomicrobium sp. CS1BSMeth3 TaxID=1892844 RepID=UPI0009302350|nr:protease modulator HflC [Hyphomicrobium sp. CS1BSMeth3]MBN9262884.1 protease modulator HflC [Hyphomicrobium sp.]MBN9279760.1 protease modulator HflC [Hyphomicrobium sp.]OJU26511.1 MAG: protease modulator HflC [Alphaproteobacteria bacterium 64-6]